MAGRSLEGLSTALERALTAGDAKALASLYLPTAVITLGVGETRLEATPEETATDRERLGLPILTSVRGIDENGDRGEIVLDWSVEGMTGDGTELELAGDATLECLLVGSEWYIAAEHVRCHEGAHVGSRAASVPRH
ncbi:MAG: hypothetical protein HOQ07_10150 [Sinomonas sp.]|nr:hypothetical protein [Sinomonas sp.]